MGFFYPLTWDTATWDDENAEDWTPNQKLGFLGSSSSLVGSYHGGPSWGPSCRFDWTNSLANRTHSFDFDHRFATTFPNPGEELVQLSATSPELKLARESKYWKRILSSQDHQAGTTKARQRFAHGFTLSGGIGLRPC